MNFNQKCYELLSKIPKGKISTYKQIANILNTKAYRAVGNAMANNPNPIIVPCHRVIKSDGQIDATSLKIASKIDAKGIQTNHYFFKYLLIIFD